MCGIFGFTINNKQRSFDPREMTTFLLRLSESRGKDASGVAVVYENTIEVLKGAIPANEFIKTEQYKNLFKEANKISCVIGHARMETNGSFANQNNNQPVVKDGIITIHNGIVVNDNNLWKSNGDISRKFEVDTEIINSLFSKYLKITKSAESALKETLTQIEGSYSIALLDSDSNKFITATNTGSLYTLKCNEMFVFASEKYFLESFCKHFGLNEKITQLLPGTQLTIEYSTAPIKERQINIGIVAPKKRIAQNLGVSISAQFADLMYREYEANRQRISHIKRCSKCLLPETMPFIEFDKDGVCNYCINHTKIQLNGLGELNTLADKYRSASEKIDCIIPFSGGRDSSFGLHFIKKELGLHPATFTYDWGMVTDLARRNIARMCGKLGVENILISADIQKKRANIHKNVAAWLKNPDLGTVPLFMAGDKHFFYYTNLIKRQTRAKLNIWMTNRLENTNFKTGFCGISPDFTKKRIEDLNTVSKIKLIIYYGGKFLKNTSFINGSLIDSARAYSSYYLEPRNDYHLLYNYIRWDEKMIEKTLINEYDWETSPDTRSTWRIGDGTASFYNYIYYTLAGFSEIDTFRSNQIREGELGRDEALKLVDEENRPRVKSIDWYCRTIGLDTAETINLINKAKKLYS